MPYFGTLNGHSHKIEEAASNLGLNVFEHNQWSWHYPGKTGLYMFISKTPISKLISALKSSFKLWIFERSKVLEKEFFEYEGEPEHLKSAVAAIVERDQFPYICTTVDEVFHRYITHLYDHDPLKVRASISMFDFANLLDRWRASQKGC
jgi:hypothetical protein